MCAVFLLVLTCLYITGCSTDLADQRGFNVSIMEKGNAFASPGEAVTEATRLMREARWDRLASYFDLSGLDVTMDDLLSGEYFRCSPPEPVHPGLRDKCTRPFPEGFSYEYHVEEGGDVTVHVGIAIDQGEGMVQRGMASFPMKRTAEGYRFVAVRGEE
jgi:hypothetical protein